MVNNVVDTFQMKSEDKIHIKVVELKIPTILQLIIIFI
jgi:hypothetical protein